jgi:hypothetical protein
MGNRRREIDAVELFQNVLDFMRQIAQVEGGGQRDGDGHHLTLLHHYLRAGGSAAELRSRCDQSHNNRH